jgi:uncharacterized membrane protein YidH (DUF202 family)
MPSSAPAPKLARPARLVEASLPSIPVVDAAKPDEASVQYSHFRTKLSTHRTGMSEHRTSLSEYRTDLSTARTSMSMRRTGMSFQRTRLSADRTLMSVIRTSLSLITFGFTTYQVFTKLKTENVIFTATAARDFGSVLVALGIAMLVLGVIYHLQFMLGLRRERKTMAEAALIHAESAFPPSMTLITALVLLLIGIAAIVSMVFEIGPFV